MESDPASSSAPPLVMTSRDDVDFFSDDGTGMFDGTSTASSELSTEYKILTQIFLQTPAGRAIAGVFAFAAIIVTCIQVRQ